MAKKLTLEEHIFKLIEPILSFYCSKYITMSQKKYKSELNQCLLETRFIIAYGKLRFTFTENLETKALLVIANNKEDAMIRINNLVFNEKHLFNYLMDKYLKKH